MLPLSTILYLLLFFFTVLGSILSTPFLGVIGYIITYHINPISQWWGSYVPQGINRYALIYGLATLIGIIIHNKELNYKKLFEIQEILLVILLITIWFSIPIGINIGLGIDENAIKMTKVTLMVLMVSHLITDLKKYEIMVYIFIATGLYLGIQTYKAPAWMFIAGRLGGGVGGSDLSNGNMLAAHFSMVISFIGIMFLKSGYKTKILCLISAAFIINGIILIRSRGSFLGLICGAVSAVYFAKKFNRKKIIYLLLAGLISGGVLVNKDFIERMKLINTDIEEMDTSALSRVEIWKLSLDIFKDHPFGVGVGNSSRVVGRYNPIFEGKDTHNTYLRALVDLGIHGLIIYFLIMINAFRTLSSTERLITKFNVKEDLFWHIFAVRVGLVSYFVTIFFVSATYIEEFFWFVMFPVFLKRVVENEIFSERPNAKLN